MLTAEKVWPDHRKFGLRPEFVIFAALVGLWVAVYAFVSPSFGGDDIFIFKDAGVNLAIGQGFKSTPAPLFDGDPTPRIFASYTPLYPLLYGIWGTVFGIGAYSNVYFDLFGAAVASCLTLFLLLPALEHRRDRLLSALILGVTLPAGGVFMMSDRPEILGYSLSAFLLLLWRRTKGFGWRSVLTLGGSAIVFLSHPFAGLLTLALFSMLLMLDPSGCADVEPFCVKRIHLLALGWVLFLTVCASAACFMLLQDHEVLRRFCAHALGKESGAGVLRNITGFRSIASFYMAQWKRALLGSSVNSVTMVFSMLISIAVTAPFLVKVLRQAATVHDEVVTRAFCSVVLVVSLTPLLLFPRQNTYYALDRALIPLFILASGTTAAQLLRRARVPLVLIGTGALFAVPMILVDLTKRVENRKSYEDALHTVRNIASEIDESRYIAISPALYPILKPIHPKLVNLAYLDEPKIAYFVQGLIVGRAGSHLASTARLPVPWALAHMTWQPLEQASSPVLIQLFGKRLMGAQWGWDFDAYRRHE